MWRRHSRWTALYNGGIAVSTHKNNHFSETSSTKISQFDISKEPNNWTKCPVTGHKLSVCHTLGGGRKCCCCGGGIIGAWFWSNPGCDRPIFCVQFTGHFVQLFGSSEMSSCEIFVGLVSEKWLFLCVETAIPPLRSAVQWRPRVRHKGIAP